MGTKRCDIACVDVEDFKQFMDKMNVDYTILNKDEVIISESQYCEFLSDMI